MPPPETVKPFLHGEVPVLTSGKVDGDQPTIEESTKTSAVPPSIIRCDVLVVGAGFSGITAIHRLRKAGLDVKCFESGEDFGGVWFWNRYPGARVDSEMPFYQLNIPEAYEDYNFPERFPDSRELRKYMAHLDKKLNLRKDTFFNARVNDCVWDHDRNLWVVKTLQGHVAECKYLFSATGLLHRTYTPDFPGLSSYKGTIYHSGAWDESFSAIGKKVGIVGAGATAVQITQELGKQADELTVFIRRPSYTIPMCQRQISSEESQQTKVCLPALFAAGRATPVGLLGTRQPCGVFDVSEAERLAHLERTWTLGGFHFSLLNYNNIATDPAANEYIYEFWKKKIRERLTDPAKQKIMTPDKMPYYFGTKRSPLEMDYWEVLNQPNVRIHDLNAAPLKEFVENGIVTADGTVHELDAVALATGFDSTIGSLAHMGLKNTDGVDLSEYWEKEGLQTYLGLMIPGFPNFFCAYSPQSPAALSNGPALIEGQVETIVAMIVKLDAEGARTLTAQPAAAAAYKAELEAVAQMGLARFTDSWWNGTNIPGRKAEVFSYMKGINVYEQECRAAMDGWKGFDVVLA